MSDRNSTLIYNTAFAAIALSILVSLPGAASAADLPASVSDVVVPAPTANQGFSGPLASVAAPLASRGITFHALAFDFLEANPSVGIKRGRASNSIYIFEGVDLDLSKLFGMPGTSLHYENIFFTDFRNPNIAGQIGDNQTGYPPAYTPRVARLSRATIEQKAFDGKLDVEVGATHPAYYYSSFNCGSINSCYQFILFINAGYDSYGYAVPGANVSYNTTSNIYAQAGVFAVQPNANFHVGYDFPDEKYNGVLGIAEIGAKTSFAIDPYPYKVALTGFINTANHQDLNATAAFTGSSRTVSGTSGVALEGEKIVWRAAGGQDLADLTPTALKLYGSIGTAIDSTVPIGSYMYVGATLLSPFAGHANDTLGLKFNWERLNKNYTEYLTAANLVAGGNGSPYSRDTFGFEANAHFQLPYGIVFEPLVNYTLHPNAIYNPTSAVKPRSGIYVGSVIVVPLGVMLGLQAAK